MAISVHPRHDQAPFGNEAQCLRQWSLWLSGVTATVALSQWCDACEPIVARVTRAAPLPIADAFCAHLACL
ncbi:MAG: hypothetical protein ACKVOJ_11565 [Sphingomonadaceae bacterium]